MTEKLLTGTSSLNTNKQTLTPRENHHLYGQHISQHHHHGTRIAHFFFFFLESPLLKIGTFFSFQQVPFEQTAFLRRIITCSPHSPQQKYSALPSKPLPSPHIFFWCAKSVCVCVCFQISSLKPLSQLKPKLMWHLNGIAEESLFRWSRSFVVLNYCHPLGGRDI